MKADLKLHDDGHIDLVICPENDAEAIALATWSDRYYVAQDERAGLHDRPVAVTASLVIRRSTTSGHGNGGAEAPPA